MSGCTVAWCVEPGERDIDRDGTVSHLHRSAWLERGETRLRLLQYVAVKLDGVYSEPVQLEVSTSDNGLNAAEVEQLRATLGDVLLDMVPSSP